MFRTGVTVTMSDLPTRGYFPSDEMLADRLGLTTKEFHRYRAQKLVTVSTTALGESTATKVTCQLGNRVWEGIVENECITFEEIWFLRGKRATGRHSSK